MALLSGRSRDHHTHVCFMSTVLQAGHEAGGGGEENSLSFRDTLFFGLDTLDLGARSLAAGHDNDDDKSQQVQS